MQPASVPLGSVLKGGVFSTETLEAIVSVMTFLIVRVDYAIVCTVGSSENFHLCVC